MDIVYFWKVVNRNKKRGTGAQPIKLDDGSLITDPDELLQKWQAYFQKLYSPSNVDGFDNEFCEMVQKKLKDYGKDMNLIFKQYSTYRES